MITAVWTPAANRSSDSQAFELSYWPLLPSSVFLSQCIECGVRSCLPLRDSSGFAPDSPIDDAAKSSTMRSLAASGFQTEFNGMDPAPAWRGAANAENGSPRWVRSYLSGLSLE